MPRLTAGQPAPAFRLEADDGSVVGLDDLRGRRTILYFYPRDDTSGCTAQACELQERIPQLDARGVRVVGVSPDSPASHRRFRERNGLGFALLSDPEHEAAEAYGVWAEKSMYGRRYMGIERSTFVIGPDGVVERALYGVRPKGHAASLLELLV